MPTPADSPFKQFLLSALSSPAISTFPTREAAHKARFAFYGTLRQLRRDGDTWGEVKDLLEAVVQPTPTGQYELRIQRKGENLMHLLGHAEFLHNVPQPPPPPTYQPAKPVAPELSDEELLRIADEAARRLDEDSQ